MKKLSVILTLILTLALYGCGSNGTTANEVSTDAVIGSDSSDAMDEQANEQVPADEKPQNDDIEVESTASDNVMEAEISDEASNNTDTINISMEDETVDNEVAEEQTLPEYTITAYDEAHVMYVIDSVNVRKGPSTEFDRIGELTLGQEVNVTGQADTNWYEIQYGEEKAYVSNKYLQSEEPSEELLLTLQQELLLQQIQSQAAAEQQMAAQIEAQKAAAEAQKAAEEAQKAAEANLLAAINAQAAAQQQTTPEIQPVAEVKNTAGIILVGDSRFVQMQEAVGPNYCTWVAEGGKGYTWFEEKAIPRINGCVGNGTKIIINLGVNDTRNLQKYITLVNAKAAEWTALGATVYYASVNPVWENPYVTEEQVVYFNTQMQNSLGPYVHWIDSHSYLTSVGYKLVDGLHYSKETSQVIYAYLLSNI